MNTESSKSLTWGQIDTHRKMVAEKIMNYSCQKCATLEYHSLNVKLLNKWFREKLTDSYLEMKNGTVQGLTSKLEESDGKKHAEVREEQTKNLKCFLTILEGFEMYNNCASEELWDYVYEHGTVQGRPLDRHEQFHEDWKERTGRNEHNKRIKSE